MLIKTGPACHVPYVTIFTYFFLYYTMKSKVFFLIFWKLLIYVSIQLFIDLNKLKNFPI